MSLTSCLAKAGTAINAEDRAAIVQAAAALRKGGMSNAAAATKAVEDRLAFVQAALADYQAAPAADVNPQAQAETGAEPAAAPEAEAQAEPNLIEVAGGILDSAADAPTGMERVNVLKDVKAGVITPDELRAAFPPATPESESSQPDGWDNNAKAKVYDLWKGGKLQLQIRHAGHPTALRPYYFSSGALLNRAHPEIATRKYANLADARAAAEDIVAGRNPQHTDHVTLFPSLDQLQRDLSKLDGEILAMAPKKFREGKGDIEGALAHPNMSRSGAAVIRNALAARIRDMGGQPLNAAEDTGSEADSLFDKPQPGGPVDTAQPGGAQDRSQVQSAMQRAELKEVEYLKLEAIYRNKRDSAGFLTALANDVSAYITKGAEAIHEALRTTIGKVAKDVLPSVFGPAGSRMSNAGGGVGISPREARAAISALQAALPGGPAMTVLDSLEAAPPELQQFIRNRGAEETIEAAHHEGQIYIFPANIESLERLHFVAAHHEIRHHGISQLLGSKAETILLDMARSNEQLGRLAQRLLDQGRVESLDEGVEEVLADMPMDEIEKLTGFDQLVAQIREWMRSVAKALREKGMDTLAGLIDPKGWSDRDIGAFVKRAEGVARGEIEITARDAATEADKRIAEAYAEANGIDPYLSAGQIDIPTDTRASIKLEGKYGNDPATGLPLNKNGSVTLYYPATGDGARQTVVERKLHAAPGSNRVYLTNESSMYRLMGEGGKAQPTDGSGVMVQIDPAMLHLDNEFPDGRKDFFIPVKEGAVFQRKMTKLWAVFAPRRQAISTTATMGGIRDGVRTGLEAYLALPAAEKRERLKEVRALLKAEHNIGTLLSENGKLEKTRVGDYGLQYNGQSVASMGLGMASAQKINDKLSTCPQSAACESLCLGDTSGQNLLYGGAAKDMATGTDFRAGPRLSQYLKTEAMVMHPEEFAILLHHEIFSLERWARKADYAPAIRLNVTTDFAPETWRPIMEAHPGVMFYDYTKLAGSSIAPNHHLTYSSTGASQLVNGQRIVNPNSNWDRMVGRLRNGQNVAMAFSSRTDMPDFVLDEKTGEKFQVWNGDNYDARFLDPKPGEEGNQLGKGMVIGLTNKDKTGRPEDAAAKNDGFFLDYDRARDGDTLTIPDQSQFIEKRIQISRQQVIDPAKAMFSRGRGSGIPLNDAKALVAAIREANPKAPPIHILDSVNKAPEKLLADIRKAGAQNDVEAAYHDGEIYVFHKNIDSIERALFVVGKHEIRHHGLRSMLGDRLGPVLMRMGMQNKALGEAARAKMQAGHANDFVTGVEEALADMDPAELTKLTGWARIDAAIRAWMRKVSDTLRPYSAQLADLIQPESWSDNDVAMMVERAQNVSRGGTPVHRVGGSAFDRVDNPTWYSALAQSVGKATMNAAPASGWKDMLKNLISTGKIKADEVAWTGLDDWLDLQQGKVSKAQVQQFLAANGVRIEETTLSDNYIDISNATVEETDSGYGIFGEDGEQIGGDYSSESAAQEDLATMSSEDRTKYSQYTLPGGTNYREVLLTLPGAKSTMRKQWAAWDGEDLVSVSPAEQPPADWAQRGWRIEQRMVPDKQASERAGQYQSGHWDQPNILAHIRVNDRTDADGKKVLFVEEIQSDWAQEGKKKGFPLPDMDARLAASAEQMRQNGERIRAIGQEMSAVEQGGQEWQRLSAERQSLQDEQGRLSDEGNAMYDQRNSGVPRAPFVDKTDKWVALALKRVIKMAVDEGYDKVAFVTGEQSAERYSLSNQIQSLAVYRVGDGFKVSATNTEGKTLPAQSVNSPEKLADTIGKDLAEKAIADLGERRSMVNYTGLDLKIGGEGMRAFYDKIVPTVAKDVLKKLGGGQLGKVTIAGRGPIGKTANVAVQPEGPGFAVTVDGYVVGVFFTEAEAKEAADSTDGEFWRAEVGDGSGYRRIGEPEASKGMAQPGFDITQTMKDKALGGMPLFSRAPGTPKWLGPIDGGSVFSRAPTTAANAPSQLAQALTSVREAKLPAGYIVNDFIEQHGKLSWWDKTVGTMHNLAQRNPLFKPVYDAANNFLNDVSSYAIEAADLAPTLLPKLEGLSDITKQPLSAADTKAISAPIFEGTLNWTRDDNGDPVPESDPQKAGIVWTTAELKSQWKLNDKQIGLYQEFRAATNKSLTDLAISDMLRYAGRDADEVAGAVIAAKNVRAAAKIIQDHLAELAEAAGADRAAVLNSTGTTIGDKADHAARMMARGYAPLTRFGNYTLDVTENGQRLYFGLFESQAEANQFARRMKAAYPKAQIQQGTLSQKAYQMFAGVSPETVELFGQMLGLESQSNEASSVAFQEYLKLAKNNRSAMKRLIQRGGIEGYSEDASRVLAGFVYSNARQASKNLHFGQITDAVQKIADVKGQGELLDTAVSLHQYITNPVEEAAKLKGLLFSNFLGGSLAAGFVNLTQTFMVTFPYLTQFGGVTKAAGQMKSALADAVKWETGTKTTGDKALDKAIKHAEDEGIISPQEVHSLIAHAGGKGALRAGDGTAWGNATAKTSNAMSKLMLVWGKPFAIAEQFNRRVTFIAAYRTAVAQGMANPAAFAEKAVVDSQFSYTKANRPAWARGAIGSTLFTFKTYSISYVELLTRMAKSGPEGRKAALVGLGMLFLMSGIQGLPGADDLDDLIDGALQRMGYNFSSKMAKREFFAKLFGETGSKFIMQGASGLPGMPIDVAGRLGLGNLIPGTGLFTKKTDHTQDVAELAGPAGAMATQLFKGADQLTQGNFGQAAQAVLPTAAQNALKAADMASTGMYRDQAGRKVIDTDGIDAAMKAIGFQPNNVATVQQATREVQQMVGLNKMRESEIADKWARGIAEQNADLRDQARAELEQWNSNNPDSRITITSAQLIKRIKAMREDKITRLEKTSPKEMRASVRQELAGVQ